MTPNTELDDCCRVDIPLQDASVCPTCAVRGKTVSRFTVSVIAKNPEIYLHPEHLPEGKYFICETKSCPTVYFSSERGIILNRKDVRVKVWQKEDSPEVPVCYCFHHTISSISDEIRKNGNTDVPSRISAEVREKNCRCEVTNPQGACCLGNVAKAVKIAKDRLLLEVNTPQVAKVNP